MSQHGAAGPQRTPGAPEPSGLSFVRESQGQQGRGVPLPVSPEQRPLLGTHWAPHCPRGSSNMAPSGSSAGRQLSRALLLGGLLPPVPIVVSPCGNPEMDAGVWPDQCHT